MSVRGCRCDGCKWFSMVEDLSPFVDDDALTCLLSSLASKERCSASGFMNINLSSDFGLTLKNLGVLSMLRYECWRRPLKTALTILSQTYASSIQTIFAGSSNVDMELLVTERNEVSTER
jgi:hypothetical protein